MVAVLAMMRCFSQIFRFGIAKYVEPAGRRRKEEEEGGTDSKKETRKKTGLARMAEKREGKIRLSRLAGPAPLLRAFFSSE